MYVLILSCLCALTKSKFWIILTISSWEKVTEYQGLLVNYWICVGRVLTLLIGNTALKKVNWNLQLFPSNYLPILHANMIKKKKKMVWVTLVCLNYEPMWTEPTRKKNQAASLITFNDEEINMCLHSNSMECEENKFDFLMTKDGMNYTSFLF